MADEIKNVGATVKADATKVVADVKADIAKVEIETFSGKVLAVVVGIAFVVGFVLAKLL